ncbi:MAG: hypothetical protein IPM63_03865 [Acidobacteriota bacterium]|nr:MAG: hypothetical protein IPM63_03865 [Acidobacteriota bacterium]
MKNETVDQETAVKVLDFPFRSAGALGRTLARTDSPDLPSLESLFEPFGERTDWSYRISSAKFLNGYAVVVASLRLADRVREGLGIARSDLEGALEQAERRALADAVAKFALRLPEPCEDVSAETENAMRRHRFASGPEAVSLGDMISYSQLSKAKSLASGLSVSIDDESEKIFGCGLSELSRDAAEELIEMLEERASGPERFKRAG